MSHPQWGPALVNPACAHPAASPSPGTPSPFPCDSGAAGGQALGWLWGMDRGHGHGVTSMVPAASSGAVFNLLSFPPKAADNPAYDGFRAPDASLQAAASQLQGQGATSQLCGGARAPSASPGTQIVSPQPAPRGAAELPRCSPSPAPCSAAGWCRAWPSRLRVAGERGGRRTGFCRCPVAPPVQAERVGTDQLLISRHPCRRSRSASHRPTDP